MALYRNTKLMNSMKPLQLYRLLMKNAKYYPSKNRFEIML